MEGYYVILGISPNSITNDVVSVGLVTYSEGRFQFAFSNRILRSVMHLMDTSPQPVQWAISALSRQLEAENVKLEEATNHAVSFETRFGIGFFDYLSRYANGLLRLAKPRRLHKALSPAEFEKLYASMIDSTQPMPLLSPDFARRRASAAFKKQVKTNLVQPLAQAVHTYFRLSPTKLPGLIFELELDCIGKNGILYGAKSMDFENVSPAQNARLILQYSMVVQAFNQQYIAPKGNNRFFLIADEPSETQAVMHQHWSELQKCNWIEVRPLKEAGNIAEEILAANATKFLI